MCPAVQKAPAFAVAAAASPHGWTIPAIDGFDVQTNMTIVTLMRECIKYAPKLETKCKNWFDRTLALGFFDGQ